MNTSINNVIARLEELRKEVGGEAHVRVQETRQTEPGYPHVIDHIEKLNHVEGDGKITCDEIIIVPYLAP